MNKISMQNQIGAIRSYFPDGNFTQSSNARLVWNGKITPSPNSLTYSIKLDYSFKKGVSVFVTNPNPLPLATGETRLPHVYSHEKQKLCLYYPNGEEWNRTKYLVHTIIPWASEWLLHYELWLVTGVWNGGGIHPSEDKDDVKNNEPEI